MKISGKKCMSLFLVVMLTLSLVGITSVSAQENMKDIVICATLDFVMGESVSIVLHNPNAYDVTIQYDEGDKVKHDLVLGANKNTLYKGSGMAAGGFNFAVKTDAGVGASHHIGAAEFNLQQFHSTPFKVEPANSGTVGITIFGETYYQKLDMLSMNCAPSILVTPAEGFVFKEFVPNKYVKVAQDGKIDSLTSGTMRSAQVKAVFDPKPADPAKEDLSVYPYNIAFMYGYGWGDFGPEKGLTREEVSAVVYRLLRQNHFTDGFVKPTTATFSDVETGRWSYSAIEFLTSKGVFDKTITTLNPQENVSRGEMAKILCLGFNMKLTDSKPSFIDMDSNNAYYPYLVTMYDRGVVEGLGEGIMAPDANLKRAEFAKMVDILIGRTKYDVSGVVNPFPDLPADHWAYNEILRAVNSFDQNGKVDPSLTPDRDTVSYN